MKISITNLKTGDKYYRLTYLGERERRNNNTYALFACDCGVVKKFVIRNVVVGSSKSCGCLMRQLARERATKYGSPAHRDGCRLRNKTYASWRNMRARCYSKNNNRYDQYGGRGICVDERWFDFNKFLADMGERPHGTALDRIDSNSDYAPGNCKWSTPAEQARNTRNSRWWIIDGVEYPSSAAAAEALDVSKSTIQTWCGRRESCGYKPTKEGCYTKSKYKAEIRD